MERDVRYARFAAAGFDQSTFEVVSATGSEAINRPIAFALDLASEDLEIDLDALLGSEGVLTLANAGAARPIRGIITEVSQDRLLGDGRGAYAVSLVSKIGLLADDVATRVYRSGVPFTLTDLIRYVLTGTADNADGFPEVPALFGEDELQFNLRHEHSFHAVVQHQESSLDFLHRVLEAEGAFYFHSEEAGREILVSGDHRMVFGGEQGHHDEHLTYRQTSGLVSDEASISAFGARRTRGPNRFRAVGQKLNAGNLEVREQDVASDDGAAPDLYARLSQEMLAGAHHDDEDLDEILARHAEVLRNRAASRAARHEGESDWPWLSPGDDLQVSGHFRTDANRGYLVLAADHRFLSDAFERDPDGPGDRPAGYGNRFVCIPDTVDFAPDAVTPVPRFGGLKSGFVQPAEDGSERPAMDDLGRYQVQITGDRRSDLTAGQASRWMAMLQPNAGLKGSRNRGFHFPLRAGTLVLWSFFDGDPNRPVIVGALPNSEHLSPVTDADWHRNVIRTASNMAVELNDGQGSSDSGDGDPQRSMTFTVPGHSRNGGSGAAADSYVRLGVATRQPDGGFADPETLFDTPSPSVSDVLSAGNDGGPPAAGIFSATGGDRSSYVKGDCRSVVGGSMTTTVGDKGPTVSYYSTYDTGLPGPVSDAAGLAGKVGPAGVAGALKTLAELGTPATWNEVAFADKISVTLGSAVAFKAGNYGLYSLGGKAVAHLGFTSSYHVGIKTSIDMAMSSDYKLGLYTDVKATVFHDAKYAIGVDTSMAPAFKFCDVNDFKVVGCSRLLTPFQVVRLAIAQIVNAIVAAQVTATTGALTVAHLKGDHLKDPDKIKALGAFSILGPGAAGPLIAAVDAVASVVVILFAIYLRQKKGKLSAAMKKLEDEGEQAAKASADSGSAGSSAPASSAADAMAVLVEKAPCPIVEGLSTGDPLSDGVRLSAGPDTYIEVSPGVIRISAPVIEFNPLDPEIEGIQNCDIGTLLMRGSDLELNTFDARRFLKELATK